MYLLSCCVGYFLGAVLLCAGQRFSKPLSEMVKTVARGHADDAADKQGPYLAPVAFVAYLLAMAISGALLVRWLS